MNRIGGIQLDDVGTALECGWEFVSVGNDVLRGRRHPVLVDVRIGHDGVEILLVGHRRSYTFDDTISSPD